MWELNSPRYSILFSSSEGRLSSKEELDEKESVAFSQLTSELCRLSVSYNKKLAVGKAVDRSSGILRDDSWESK